MLAPVLVTAPTVDVVSPFEAKEHFRVDSDDDNGRVAFYLSAATGYFDGWDGVLGVALTTQTWRADLTGFPGDKEKIRLPLGPVQSIDSITYYDTDNASQTLSAALYSLHRDHRGDYIKLSDDEEWPDTYTRDDAVRVTWVAGYGDVASDVPAKIRQAILLLAAHWYEQREPVAMNAQPSELPYALRSLIATHRRARV